ncbi:MAG TPA: serine/threonine protein phosphatase [Cyanobacteria bacterium UBA12227]|nr:serine/threonine protein phosphatase [Cyanobacteria bacterium UBA12227]HAX86220.1 serine/threonine protein phosphatase [Cyanobacteria bacterium UBA11370]HBY80387.1 serine/threonine protein phosphatase [Cyanobacteria bacterium UBA11148]
MTHRRIVIGDVHGHYDTLMTLLDAIAPTGDDRVYFLGDLIDRGPQSSQVVEFVKRNGYPCLLGNHEQMVLDILGNGDIHAPSLQAWLYSGGHSTINSYGEQGVSQEHLDWMRTLPTYLDLGDIWLVHAGVHPQLPIEKQTADQFCWIREEFHGIQEPYFRDKLIITGHTITFTIPGVMPGKIAQGRGWLDIDTGAYHPKSGWLTGLDITNAVVYQVHTFEGKIRQMPLEKAMTRVEPSQVFPRRSMMRS